MTLAPLLALLTIAADPAPTVIRVDATRVLPRTKPLLYGVCIEDVNHEVYGGLYSQLVFGESFQEPPRPVPIVGFDSFGGAWRVENGELSAEAGDGPKLLASQPLPDGPTEVAVEVFLPDARDGNAGLILRVDKPGVGADAFAGYEVSLEAAGFLMLGRHRQDWEPIRRIPCPVPVGQWVRLAVKLDGPTLAISVDGQPRLTYEDTEHPLTRGSLGLRTWRRPARFRNLSLTTTDGPKPTPFASRPVDPLADGVSGMWAGYTRGDAKAEASLDPREPFAGRQSQRLAFVGGTGEVGVENRGLNRWGLDLKAGQLYEGYVWARGKAAFAVALETADGGVTLAETKFEAGGDAWARHDFTLTPNAAATGARFAIKLDRPGSITLGHAFLQPGVWGRYKGLPVRQDVAEGLVDMGVNVIRYGGLMANHPEYRWKNMIGPRDRRPATSGWWYPYSSNGWGIVDFLDLGEAMGIVAIPDVSADESPRDLVDFVEYANGPATSEWGQKRVAAGHPAPYRLKHIEIGNEEAVDEAYWARFKPIAEAIWSKDPDIIVVVGDFAYSKPIVDPDHFEGGARVNSLAAHRKILQLAREHDREVWFDIHINTNEPPEPHGLVSERSYIAALTALVPGAKVKVAIFEYNSGNHAMKRALSNALATIEVDRIGDAIPVACIANGLQPDGQNDDGWDQGLLFLNPAKAWLQPPGYELQMASQFRGDRLLAPEIEGDSDGLTAIARCGAEGKRLVLKVVNTDNQARSVAIELDGFRPTVLAPFVTTLSGPLNASNPAVVDGNVVPRHIPWRQSFDLGIRRENYSFEPRSITYIWFH